MEQELLTVSKWWTQSGHLNDPINYMHLIILDINELTLSDAIYCC